jgi:DNA-directed RNA polymerase specialized sigma24 family protein
VSLTVTRLQVKPDPALARRWRQRLRADGFEDIELPDGTLRPSKKPPGRWRSFDKAHPVERHAVEAYFSRALHFTASHAFRKLSKRSRAIWRLHAQGQSNMEIASALNLSVKIVRVAITRARLAAKLPEVTSSLGHGQ